ncbi:MAG: hypothetical protein OXC70_03420 [Gammaproteobacteria bacterium]|nr:hypothetical protein [Gammaproteobacteria bacterium]
MSASAIVAVIESTATDFDTSVIQLAALSRAGVDSEVLEAMTRASAATRLAPPQVAARRSPAPSPQPGPTSLPPTSPEPVFQPGQTFSDALSSGGQGPEMVVIPAGRFYMGCVSGQDCYDDEMPHDGVTIPEECALEPSSVVDTLDGQAVDVEALLLGPDGDVPIDAERNAASLGMRLTVQGASGSLRALLLGDMGHDQLTRVFARDDLTWDVLLAPHPCSTTALCLDGGSGAVDDDLTSAIEATRSTCAYIVASAGKIPSSDKDGADPPHARAKRAYERIVQAGHFVCTGEHFAAPRELAPIAFDTNRSGCGYVPLPRPATRRPRPADPPPARPVRFGSRP